MSDEIFGEFEFTRRSVDHDKTQASWILDYLERQIAEHQQERLRDNGQQIEPMKLEIDLSNQNIYTGRIYYRLKVTE